MAVKNTLSQNPLEQFREVELFAIPTLSDNYTYALKTPDQIWIIDPGESAPVLEWCSANHRAVTHIICTHHHHDHVDGVPDLKSQFSVQVYCSDHDLNRIPGADEGLADGAVLKVGTLELKTIMIPGHTLGHMALYLEEANWLFTGDTLFGMGCGRLFEGTPAQMFSSLAKIKTLPQVTKLFWGHEYTARNLQFALSLTPESADLKKRGEAVVTNLMHRSSTLPGNLAEELATNPFLMAKDVAAFAEIRLKRDSF